MATNFGILFLCLIIGILLQFNPKFPKNTAAVLNQFIFHISFPAMILLQFHRVVFNSSSIFPIAMPWALFILSYSAFIILAQPFQLTRKQIGALILTGGLGNTSFVGFPMLEALFGPDAIQTGMLSDQLGSVLIISTLGLFVSCQFAGQKFKWNSFFKRIATFPPVYAMAIGVALRPFEFAPAVEEILTRLGSTITPIALVSVGFQLRLDRKVLLAYRSKLALGLVFKLVFVPLLFWGLYFSLFGTIGRDAKITLIQSAMAPMISAGVLASEFGLDDELSSLMVGVGIPLSLFTIPVYYWLLG